MSQPNLQEHISWGNQQSSPYPQLQNTETPPAPRNLKGSKIRALSGIIIIVCGVVEIGLGITLMSIHINGRYRSYYEALDAVGCGIWNGVFAIIAGLFGLYSKRSKCKIITYMVLTIISAVMSAGCVIWAADASSKAAYLQRDDYHWYDHYFPNATNHHSWSTRYPNATNHLAMYIIICVTFAVHMVVAIIGASRTCSPLCYTQRPGAQCQTVVYYTPYQIPQQPVHTFLPPVTHQPMQAALSGEQPPPEYNTIADAKTELI